MDQISIVLGGVWALNTQHIRKQEDRLNQYSGGVQLIH